MATLDDLDIRSILEMGDDEAVEHIRQIRLNRRTQAKEYREKKISEQKAAKRKPQPLTAAQAAELLKMLEEGL